MIWGLTAGTILILTFLALNWKRARLDEVKELIPNCLLTTYPLVFVPGHRSLFYFLAYWNQIPHWLASHGYEVFHLPMPWKGSEKRKQALAKFLKEKSQSGEVFHLFIDESSLPEMTALLEDESYDCLASVTLIGQHRPTAHLLKPRLRHAIEELELPMTAKGTPVFWRLHQLWTLQTISLSQLGWKLDRPQGEEILKRAQFLAERDLIQRPRSPNL